MLSSIHPLGERTRNNRWGVTVGAFAMGAIIAGALVGWLLGWAGAAVLDDWGTTPLLIATSVVILAAGALDLAGVEVPGPKRQVNEHWIGAYRGWVYGGAFGFELGVGVMTYVVTWSVYALFAIEFLTASPLAGALVGAVFGVGRSLALFFAGTIDRASRLTAFHSRMDSLGPAVRALVGYGAIAIGCIAVGGALL